MTTKKKRPLEGIRVLEIASMIFGPLAGQYLGDMGADVIKLEPPEGDLTRSIGPRRSPLMGAFFLTSNRSKRSIVVDLKKPEGQEIRLKLVARTDVLLHSLRTPAANRLGLDYAKLSKDNPGLIYCHVTGYGDDGLYAGRPAYDDIIQAASGLADLQTVVAGQPRFVPTIIADKISGIHPGRRGLYFMGLFNVAGGGNIRMMDDQAEWITDLVTGEMAAPDAATMRTVMAEEQAFLRKHYPAAPRYALELDPVFYRKQLTRERELARARPRAGNIKQGVTVDAT